MNDAVILLVDQAEIPTEEVVPGVARPVRATLRAGDETLGVFVGRLPPTRAWERADQDLLELYATEVAVAIRNSQLLTRVEAQNEALRDLGEQKDDFFRGVSHNLQTPLARIRATAEGLLGESGDRRAAMIVEQSDRLSRMVRQLMTVTRLESGTLKPRADVLSVGVRARRAWDALAIPNVPFSLEDRSAGWLAVADVDALDQVIWALLDNAVKYGGGTAITATIDAEPETSRIRLTIGDQGPGVGDEDRERLFTRFARGTDEEAGTGSGLGLYVSRELCRAMNGDLVLEPAQPGRGATFCVSLPGEPPTE
jgi:signal transduction histidine kinase